MITKLDQLNMIAIKSLKMQNPVRRFITSVDSILEAWITDMGMPKAVFFSIGNDFISVRNIKRDFV